jgi:hypothetical protein
MPTNIDLKIERQYNGVINCLTNSKSNPKSLETTLNNLKKIFKISNKDYYNFYKLALKNNRPELVIILLKVINNINIPLRTFDDIFYTICTKKSQYLKDFLNSNWIDLVDIKEIYDILIEKINYSLIAHGDHMLSEYRRQDLYLNQHLKSAQEQIIMHKKGAKIILEIEKIIKVSIEQSNYWHSSNPILKKRKEIRIKARWTLIFFFSKYVIKGIHNWIWMPGGYMFKKGEKNWLNYQNSIKN